MKLHITVHSGAQDGKLSGCGSPEVIHETIEAMQRFMDFAGGNTADVVVHQTDLVEFEAIVRAKIQQAGFNVSEREALSDFWYLFRIERTAVEIAFG